jgi:hypothetical protein
MTAAVLRVLAPRRAPAGAPGLRLSVCLSPRLPGAVAAPHRCPVGSCPSVIGAGRLVCRAHRRRLPGAVRRDLRRAWAEWLAAVLAALGAAGAGR